MSNYENLKNQKPHIAAQIKKECGILTSFTVLSALDIQEIEINKLRNALKLATRWGIRSDGYSAEVSSSIREWVDDGMKGDVPKQPDYYPHNKENNS